MPGCVGRTLENEERKPITERVTDQGRMIGKPLCIAPKLYKRNGCQEKRFAPRPFRRRAAGQSLRESRRTPLL